MRTLVALALTFSFFLGTNCYSSNSLYTWKDDRGVLNITDSPPPAGAELLDVSPSTHQQSSSKAKARSDKKIEKKAVTRQPASSAAVSEKKKKLLVEADKYRKQQTDAIKEGKELTAEIEAWQAKSGTKRKRRRNNRKIKGFNERIDVINQRIETADKKASALEKKAAGMQ